LLSYRGAAASSVLWISKRPTRGPETHRGGAVRGSASVRPHSKAIAGDVGLTYQKIERQSVGSDRKGIKNHDRLKNCLLRIGWDEWLQFCREYRRRTIPDQINEINGRFPYRIFGSQHSLVRAAVVGHLWNDLRQINS
jgi:hypothetical protein